MPPLHGRKLLLLLIVSHFSVDLYGSFLAPLQPYLIQRHHLSLAQAGFLVGLYSISASLMQPVYGYLADRVGKRIFVVFAPLTAALFMSMLPLAPSPSMLMLLLFLGGVGVASFHPQASSFSHQASGSRRGLGMSLFISGGNIGSAVGPVYLMFLLSKVGFDSSYLVIVPGALIFLLLLFYCPELQRSDASRHRALFEDVRKYIRPLTLLYVIVVLRTLVQLSFLTYIPVLLQQWGARSFQIGFAVTCFMALGAVGGMTGGFLFDRVGGRNLFIISAAVSPLFLFLTPLANDPSITIFFFMLSGFFLMMTIPISVLMGQTIVPNAISTVSSLMMGFGWGVGGMLVPVVGSIADRYSISLALGWLAAIPLICLPLAWMLPGKSGHGPLASEVPYSVER